MKALSRKLMIAVACTTLSVSGTTIMSEAGVAASSISELPEPTCIEYKIRFWKEDDCSARDTWRAYLNVYKKGTMGQVRAATYFILMPASEKSGVNYADRVSTLTASSRYCSARAINMFLTETRRKKQVIGDGRTLVDLLIFKSNRGTAFTRGQFKQTLPIVWAALESEAGRASAKSAYFEAVACV